MPQLARAHPASVVCRFNLINMAVTNLQEDKEMWMGVDISYLALLEKHEWGCDVDLGTSSDGDSEPGWSGRRRRRTRHEKKRHKSHRRP